MEERWGFLTPWCAELKSRLEYLLPHRKGELWDLRTKFLRVRLPYRESFRGVTQEGEFLFQQKFQFVQEALAILAVVATVDHNAWKFLLEKKCGLNLGTEGEEQYEQEIPVQFQLTLDVRARPSEESDDSFDSDLVRFCGATQHRNPSLEYLETLEQIAVLDENLTLATNVKVPVFVNFHRTWSGIMFLMEDISKAEKAIMAEWEVEIEEMEPRCTFVLQPMQADFGHNFKIRPGMADLIDKLVAQNVWFSQVFLFCSAAQHENDERDERQLFGKVFARIFDSTRRARAFGCRSDTELLPDDSQPLQLGAVHLDCSGTKLWEFEALCSAMVVNQTTKKLSINLEMDPNNSVTTHHRWKWMAYAFFSKRARQHSSLESLALIASGSMSLEDMEGFVAVVTSEHPEEELFNCPRGRVDERVATLKTGSQVRWEFDGEGEPVISSNPLIFESPKPFVRTFSDNAVGMWVNVLIPGYGRCQVQRRDLEFHEPESHDDSSSRLTSLQLGYDEEDRYTWTGLPSFLAAVGPSLQFLGLGYHEGGFKDIIGNCPNLQELTFCGDLVAARLDFSDFHAAGEPLPTLNYDSQNAEVLSNALKDLKSPLARCLRRLRVLLNFWLDHHTNVNSWDEHVKPILETLEANQRLEYLDICLDQDHLGYIDEIRTHHLKPMERPQPFESLSIVCKVAFLSVVKPKVATSALHDLDQFALSNIFEYVAPPILRQIYAFKTTDNGSRWPEYEII